jgi:rhamnosyltransferase subunit B
VNPILHRLLKDAVKKLDLPLPRCVMTEWCYSSQCTVGLFGDWFCPWTDDWPSQLVLTGFPLFDPHEDKPDLSEDLRRFLDSGTPPVVFTAGAETAKPRAFFEAMVKATTESGVRGVFLTRLADQLPRLPETICHVSYTCLDLLIAKSCAIVHHGGIGTTARAIQAGIPQLILPKRLDQFDNARHIGRLGCGLVQINFWDGSAVAGKLQYLLPASAVKRACNAARTRLKPGLKARSDAANVVEQTFRAAQRAIMDKETCFLNLCAL